MSDDKAPPTFTGTCPLPLSDYPTVQLAHGGGGRLSQMLIEKVFLEAFRNPVLEGLADGAVLGLDGGGRLAFSTDTFVVRPLFFPGGDIGSLAVHGTVNDVAMCGARPLALSAGYILEEGFPMEKLWRIVSSMKRAAEEAGVPLVTGDTKVVDQRQRRRRLHQHHRHRPGARRASTLPRPAPAPVTGSSSPAASPSTASPSCRCARAWSSRPSSRPTRRPCTA